MTALSATIKTTITTRLDITDDGIEPFHEVDVECKDPIPEPIVQAAVQGALLSLLGELNDNDTKED